MSARAWAHPVRMIRWAFIAVLALIGLAIAASAVVYALRGPGPGFFFPFGWVFILLFFLFFWGLRWRGGWGWYGRPYWHYPGDGAKEILRERYARGEIGKDQFDQMSRDLEAHP